MLDRLGNSRCCRTDIYLNSGKISKEDSILENCLETVPVLIESRLIVIFMCLLNLPMCDRDKIVSLKSF